MLRICVIFVLSFGVTACERPSQSVSITSFEECEQGISKKQINDLIALLSEFDVAGPEDEQRFYRKLGGPEYPLVSPGCYGIGYIDILEAIIPKRVVSFDIKPFSGNRQEESIKKIYTKLIGVFSGATQGEWRALGIQVDYNADQGQVKIRFKSFNETHRWRVDQHEAQDRVGDDFFDSLVKFEVARLSGMFVDLSRGRQKNYAYLPKKLVPQLRRMGLQ